MIFLSGKKMLFCSCAFMAFLLLPPAAHVSGQEQYKAQDTLRPCGDDAVRKLLKEKNPDFDKQLQEHEAEVQQKLAEKQKADRTVQKKSGKKIKTRTRKKKIKR